MDLIDRQSVRMIEMDEKQEHPTFNLDDAYEQGFEDCLTKVLALPSAQPERKSGKWTEKEVNDEKVIDEWQSARCSVCGKYHTTPYMYYFNDYPYCPHCGSQMEGGAK